MAYLTYAAYTEMGKSLVPQEEFDLLADMASDVIDAIVRIPIDSEKHDMEKVAKATAYEVETLYSWGGVSAVYGTGDKQKTVTERLDDYTVTEQSGSTSLLTANGIPIASLAVDILRKLGLMCRWLYAGRYRNGR
ncbi:MAG: hypothetical protein J6A79_07825 [Clostridia bacterium]|nr:hypothetical protein [Clostridia bacterium]